MTDRRQAVESVPVGARLALAVAVVATTLLGGATAGLAGAALGLVGSLAAVGVGAAVRALVRPDNRSRALGSVGLVCAGSVAAGSVAALGLLGLYATVGDVWFPGSDLTTTGDAVVLGLAIAGVVAAAADVFVESPGPAGRELRTATWRSAQALVAGIVLGLVGPVLLALPVRAVAAVAGALSVAGRRTPGGDVALLTALVTLQILAVAVVWLVRTAVPTLTEWVASATTSRESEVEVDRLLDVLPAPEDLPPSLWGALVLQLVVVVFFARPFGQLLGLVLAVLGPLGDALRGVVAAGVLHWPLLFAGLLAAAVLGVEFARQLFVGWAGRNPPTTLGYAAGGVVGVAVAWTLGVTTVAAELALGVSLDGGSVAPWTGLALLAGLLLAATLVDVPARLARLAGVGRAPGFAAGAAALLVAALSVAVTGLPPAEATGTAARVSRLVVPFAAVAGVAASVLVWDLGENAVSLRAQLGPETDTREAELTHAVASGLVAAGAVALATVSYYLAGPLLFGSGDLGPLSLSGLDRERALVALGLALVALFALGIFVDRGGSASN